MHPAGAVRIVRQCFCNTRVHGDVHTFDQFDARAKTGFIFTIICAVERITDLGDVDRAVDSGVIDTDDCGRIA